MRILGMADVPAFSLDYRSAAHGRGNVDVGLEVRRCFVDALPPGLAGLLVTSDLQGWSSSGDRRELLGVALAAALRRHCDAHGIERSRVGVLLAGDLYANGDLSQSGGCGDVRPVWRAFAAQSAFTAGVAGNHDSFGTSAADVAAFAQEPGIALLDTAPPLRPACEFAGLRIAGVSGVVGNPARPWRKHPDVFVDAVAAALATQPDVLLLHQNPALPGVRRDELTRLTQLLAVAGQGLVVFGHAFCPEPLVTLGRCQLLATEGRAFWLERAPGSG
jgi:hypothetical protein